MEKNNQEQLQSTQSISPSFNPKGSRFASASLLLGVFSTACGLFLFWTPLVLIGFLGGGLAILFSILSKGNYNEMEKRAKTGFIFGVIGPIITTITLSLIITSSLYFLRNDETLRETTRESIVAYEEELKNVYGEKVIEDYEKTYGKEFDLGKSFDQLFGE